MLSKFLPTSDVECNRTKLCGSIVASNLPVRALRDCARHVLRGTVLSFSSFPPSVGIPSLMFASPPTSCTAMIRKELPQNLHRKIAFPEVQPEVQPVVAAAAAPPDTEAWGGGGNAETSMVNAAGTRAPLFVFSFFSPPNS